MIPVNQFESIYLHRDAVDFRKSIEGLSAIVQNEMNQNIFSNHLFVFTNKRRNKVKILYWDKTGHALWYKRLDQKQFKWPLKYHDEVLSLDPQNLEWLLSGIDIMKINPHQELFYKNLK
jgi:transposase